MRTELTIVIPLVNSSRNLIADLSQISQSLIKNSISAEIVIVSSSDSLHLSKDEYDSLSSRSLLKIRAVTATEHKDKKRLGHLLRLGSSLADSRFVLFLIPEGKFDSAFLPKALAHCRKGASLVIANRINEFNLDKTGAKRAFLQQAISRRTFKFLGMKLPLDITNSTRMFDKQVFDALAISGLSWDMLAEHTIKTKLINEAVVAIDVEISAFEKIGDFKISILDRLFGSVRITSRTIFHKLGLLWY
jgi:hypothetical protein